MPMIDADAHVIETEQTWDFMDERDSKFRPVLITPYNDKREFWLIDGKTRQRQNVNETCSVFDDNRPPQRVKKCRKLNP